MKSRFVQVLLFLLFAVSISAQKKDMLQIQDLLKKGTELDKAQTMAETLLKDSANQHRADIWLLLGECLYKRYESQNERLYLHQQLDTAAFFANIQRLFSVYQKVDSFSQSAVRPNKKVLRHLQKRANDLNKCRPNLYHGGLYKLFTKKYNAAYTYFDDYLKGTNSHLFKAFNYSQTDTLLAKAAFWSVYSGYMNRNPQQMLHHSYTALKDTANRLTMLQYLSEAYKLENDTSRYIQTLQEGFDGSPSSPYFFPRLFNHYASNGDWGKCMELSDKGISVAPADMLFHVAKSTVLLYTERYDECIALCDSIIAVSDTLSRAYLNAGLSHYYKAVRLDKLPKKSKADQRNVIANYSAARPYLETYRRLVPGDADQWALPLYLIYLNLNMGDEFDQIDCILKKKRISYGHN